MSRRKKPREAGFFHAPSGFHRLDAITWGRMRRQQEPMRQQQAQKLPLRQVPMLPQQQVLRQERGRRLLLFCRKRTKQLQR